MIKPSTSRFLVLLLAGTAAVSCSERPVSSAAGTSMASVTPTAVPSFKAISDAPALLALPAGGTCSLENLVDVSTMQPSPGQKPNSYAAKRSLAYKLIGFATDSSAGAVPPTIRVLLHGPGGSYAFDGATGLQRDDVAKFFGKPELARSGYQIDAAFTDVQSGEYEVHVVRGTGNAASLCPTHQAIIVD